MPRKTTLRAQASLALMSLAMPEIWNLQDQDPFPSQPWAGPLLMEMVEIPIKGTFLFLEYRVAEPGAGKGERASLLCPCGHSPDSRTASVPQKKKLDRSDS